MSELPTNPEQWIEEIDDAARPKRYTVVIEVTLTELNKERRERIIEQTLEQVELLRQAP